MCPLKTNKDMRKLKWQDKLWHNDMPKKRLPAVVDGAAWEKITKGRGGMR